MRRASRRIGPDLGVHENRGMTRIIAGTAGSIALATPKGSGTRPTSDRVREAVFGALQSRGAVSGATVLDLFAGSGALGLEAISRGATSVDLVEQSAAAAAVARANATRVADAARLPGSVARVHRVSVSAFLQRAASGPYDLVFLDPPYALNEPDLGDAIAALVPMLAPGALVVVERATRSTAPRWPDGLVPETPRRYGETSVHIASWMAD